jgi:hypothetical protein
MHKAFDNKIKIKIEIDLDLLFDILDSYKDDISIVKNALAHEWVVVLPKEKSGFIGISGYNSINDCFADLNTAKFNTNECIFYHYGQQVDNKEIEFF